MRIAQRVAASASLCAPQARASRSRSRAAPRRCVRAMATARFAIPQETLSKLGAAMKPIDSVFDMVKGAKVVLVGESRRAAFARSLLLASMIADDSLCSD